MWQKKDIVNEFQRLGKRITKQRMVILDVILEQNWTDCKEVYYEAVQRDSTVGLSTVYRTIRMLEEMGVLKRVYQYVFTDETGVRADGENEVIAPGMWSLMQSQNHGYWSRRAEKSFWLMETSISCPFLRCMRTCRLTYSV